MSLHTVRWYSAVLEKQTETHVVVPETGGGPFPVFYLLHGLTDDSSMWLRRSRIECYAEEFPFIIVMPDGYRGFYTDNEEGPAYARHIGEELPAFIDRLFPTKAERASRCIGGLSMGGYGALRIGLGFHEKFVSVNSHSGAVAWGNNDGATRAARACGKGDGFAAEIRRIFGEHPEGTDHHLLTLAKRAKKAKMLPKILMDCGTEDFLIADNRAFSGRLTEAKIPHEYREHPGAHDWAYWDTHVQDALRFHAKAIKRR